jgi:hypothetical protein
MIPFNVFYDALHQFLDHSHKGVIIRAADNSHINPDHEVDCFNVNVLKTLFMIKYVNEISANIDNITSLMTSEIDTDRIALKKDVEEALNVLVRQMLVQKNGDIYVFLTDEEQEINREIDGQSVEMAEVISKASELIFEDIFSDKKYRYPAYNGRYSFAFNQLVDDRPYKSNQNNDISVRILTPASDYSEDEITLRMMSGQGKEVLVVLPSDSAFLNELRSALKIEKYMRLSTANKLTKFEQIKESKRVEMRDRNGNAKLFLEESMKNANIYVNGDKAQIGSKEVSSRINDALGRLVSTVYHKLSYIDTAMNEANIRALFKTSSQQSFALAGVKEPNANALHDVLSYISDNSSMHTKTSMKSIMDRFMKAPYGFVEDDVEWLVAKLFKDGDISFTLNGGSITLLNKTEEELIRYITKKEYVEKLLTERRQQAGEVEKKAVREVMKELFGISSVNDDDDSMMQSFQSYCKNIINELEKFEIMYSSQMLPGKKTVAIGKGLLRAVVQIQSPTEFFKKVHSGRDDLLDFAEDYEPVKAFFAGEQKIIFERALRLEKIYDESKTFIVAEKVEEYVGAVKNIIKNDAPYGDIPKLPQLLDQFNDAYMHVLSTMKTPILEAIADAQARVFEVLDSKHYKDELSDCYFKLFKEINDKANHCNNVATLQNIKIEADALKVRLLNEISKRDEKPAQNGGDNTDLYTHQPKPKKRKTISIKTISLSSSWQIETAEDIDKYMKALKSQILKELDDDTIISIEL